MNKDELNKVLEDHKLWLDSNGDKGTRANLTLANLSKANLSWAYLSEANLTGANLTGANLTGAYLSGANLSGAYLTGAYLSGANLNRAYLTLANLSKANLSWAYLSEANLTGAYLSGANLSCIKGKEIHRFNGPRHEGIYVDGIITLGCESHPIEHWIENYTQIGLDHGYTNEEIEIYGKWIKRMFVQIP